MHLKECADRLWQSVFGSCGFAFVKDLRFELKVKLSLSFRNIVEISRSFVFAHFSQFFIVFRTTRLLNVSKVSIGLN